MGVPKLVDMTADANQRPLVNKGISNIQTFTINSEAKGNEIKQICHQINQARKNSDAKEIQIKIDYPNGTESNTTLRSDIVTSNENASVFLKDKDTNRILLDQSGQRISIKHGATLQPTITLSVQMTRAQNPVPITCHCSPRELNLPQMAVNSGTSLHEIRTFFAQKNSGKLFKTRNHRFDLIPKDHPSKSSTPEWIDRLSYQDCKKLDHGVEIFFSDQNQQEKNYRITGNNTLTFYAH